jgi:hypothetical protein
MPKLTEQQYKLQRDVIKEKMEFYAKLEKEYAMKWAEATNELEELIENYFKK